ncbi:MAG: FAD-binding oxidoreductase, partial [Roseiarcus sp.]
MDATKRETILAALHNIVGTRHVLTDPSLIAGALVEPRGLYHGKALALVRPGATKEVASVAAFCNEARIGMAPQGGNTGLVGGQTPDLSGEEIIVSTQRLRAIREVDLDGDVMICEAGVTLAEARTAALATDRLFPLSLASEGTCTIGGNVSTNAGGVTVVAYGNTRDLVTGVEAVLADGRIVNALSKLRKDNTGYDVKSLFIGAEGTLGVVTAASLRLFANPRGRATAFVGLKSPEDALKLLRMARERLGAEVTSFELIGRSAYDIGLRHGGARAPLGGAHDWYVLIEASSQALGGLDEAFAGALEAALDKGIVEDASIAASLEQRAAFWHLRECLS